MVMHSDYPALVEEALVSDLYWAAPNNTPSPIEGVDAVSSFAELRSTLAIAKDQDLKNRIGSIAMSMEAGGSFEAVPFGESLPEPVGRQVLKVVQDSRKIEGRFSPPYLVERHFRKLQEKQSKQVDPEYKLPTFAEKLQAIYESRVPFVDGAQSVIPVGLGRVALVERAVYYLGFHESTGRFAAMNALFANKPEYWERAILLKVPPVKVGETYSLNGRTNALAKIVSAEVMEATGVAWKTPNKPGQKDDKRKFAAPSSPLRMKGLVNLG